MSGKILHIFFPSVGSMGRRVRVVHYCDPSQLSSLVLSTQGHLCASWFFSPGMALEMLWFLCREKHRGLLRYPVHICEYVTCTIYVTTLAKTAIGYSFPLQAPHKYSKLTAPLSLQRESFLISNMWGCPAYAHTNRSLCFSLSCPGRWSEAWKTAIRVQHGACLWGIPNAADSYRAPHTLPGSKGDGAPAVGWRFSLGGLEGH